MLSNSDRQDLKALTKKTATTILIFFHCESKHNKVKINFLWHFHIFNFIVLEHWVRLVHSKSCACLNMVLCHLGFVPGTTTLRYHPFFSSLIFEDEKQYRKQKNKKSKHSVLFLPYLNSNQRACTKKPIKIWNINPTLSAAPLLKTNVWEQAMTTRGRPPPIASQPYVNSYSSGSFKNYWWK